MKTLTQFTATALKTLQEQWAEVSKSGKTAEEMPAAFGELTKLEGDKLAWAQAALEMAKSARGSVKRIIVQSLAEGEKPPTGATQKGDHWFSMEYFPEAFRAPPKFAERGFGGRGGSDGGRGGKGGRDGGRDGGRGGDKRGGPGGRDGDRPGGGRGRPGEKKPITGPDGNPIYTASDRPARDPSAGGRPPRGPGAGRDGTGRGRRPPREAGAPGDAPRGPRPPRAPRPPREPRVPRPAPAPVVRPEGYKPVVRTRADVLASGPTTPPKTVAPVSTGSESSSSATSATQGS